MSTGHSFRRWLHHVAKATNSPSGDFVADARADPEFPDTDNWAVVRGYLHSRTTDSAVHAAGRACWRNYRCWADRHLFMSEWPVGYRIELPAIQEN